MNKLVTVLCEGVPYVFLIGTGVVYGLQGEYLLAAGSFSTAWLVYSNYSSLYRWATSECQCLANRYIDLLTHFSMSVETMVKDKYDAEFSIRSFTSRWINGLIQDSHAGVRQGGKNNKGVD